MKHKNGWTTLLWVDANESCKCGEIVVSIGYEGNGENCSSYYWRKSLGNLGWELLVMRTSGEGLARPKDEAG